MHCSMHNKTYTTGVQSRTCSCSRGRWNHEFTSRGTSLAAGAPPSFLCVPARQQKPPLWTCSVQGGKNLQPASRSSVISTPGASSTVESDPDSHHIPWLLLLHGLVYLLRCPILLPSFASRPDCIVPPMILA